METTNVNKVRFAQESYKKFKESAMDRGIITFPNDPPLAIIPNQNLKMYILVNKDLEMSRGKLAGQVGHACNVLTYVYCNGSQERQDLINKYMLGSIKKIVLGTTEAKLLYAESMGGIAIRDAGYTELEPDTLTCVALGIFDAYDIPEDIRWVKRLQLLK